MRVRGKVKKDKKKKNIVCIKILEFPIILLFKENVLNQRGIETEEKKIYKFKSRI